MDDNLSLVQKMFENSITALNEKIDLNNRNLTDKIGTNNERILDLLGSIKYQTTKTNGRVTSLEGDVKQLTATYNNHLVTSVPLSEIEKINKRIDEESEQNFIVKVWNRYPRQILTVITVSVLMALATIAYTLYSVRNIVKNVKDVETVQTDDNGRHYND